MKREEIEKILKEKVDPILGEHFGGAILTGYEKGVARVRLTGACSDCPSAQDTLENIIKDILMQECDGLKDVVLDTSVSDDLLDMAKKILNGEVD